jgi:molybdopterin synthase catalytic subunit
VSGSAKPFLVTRAPLDVGQMVDLVRADADGAVDIFVGVVRDNSNGRRVLFLEYEAYPEMAEQVFRQIAREIADRWGTERVAIHHRVGQLKIGEASVVIAVAAPHRAQAFEACRYAIERIKEIAPIWKKEHFEGGAVWVEGPTAQATP